MVYNNNDMFKAYVVLSLIPDQVENIYGCKKKKRKKKKKKKKMEKIIYMRDACTRRRG